MQKYMDLIMGLISGVTLTLLNTDLVYGSLKDTINIFIPQISNSVNIVLS